MVARAAWVLLSALLAACGGTPAPAPATDQGAVVGVTVRVARSQTKGTWTATTVHFVRLEGDADPTRVGKTIASAYEAAGACYLLDAEPGRYAAVACVEKRDGHTWTTYFPADLIRATVVEVPQGGFASMGRVRVEATRLGRHADRAQDHYARILGPDWNTVSKPVQLFAKSKYWLGGDFDIGRDPAAEREKARKALERAGWGGRFGG